MIGRVHPNLSELAYHIVSLYGFWRRAPIHSDNDRGVDVIAAMIAFSFGSENGHRIARSIVRELDSITSELTNREIDPDGIEVIFISTLLQEHIVELDLPADDFYGAFVSA